MQEKPRPNNGHHTTMKFNTQKNNNPQQTAATHHKPNVPQHEPCGSCVQSRPQSLGDPMASKQDADGLRREPPRLARPSPRRWATISRNDSLAADQTWRQQRLRVHLREGRQYCGQICCRTVRVEEFPCSKFRLRPWIAGKRGFAKGSRPRVDLECSGLLGYFMVAMCLCCPLCFSATP